MERSLSTKQQNTPEPIQSRFHAHNATVPWWVIGGLGVLFVILGLTTVGPNTLTIDLDVSGWIQSFDSRTAQGFSWIGDELGGTRTALACLVIGFVAVALMRNARDALFLSIAAILRVLAAVFLKGLYDSPRPTFDQVEQARVFANLGYPSGHATTASLLMGTLAYFITRRTDNPGVRIGLAVLWFIGVSSTAFARVWYGAHWFTDTIGGAIAGLIMVLLAANVSAAVMDWRASGRRRQRPRTPAR